MSKKDNKICLQITSGQGPDECALAVRKLVLRMQKEAKVVNVELEVLGHIEGNKKNTYVSALLCLTGEKAQGFAGGWVGTIQWVCESPYRPRYKRKNWFIGVRFFEISSSEQIVVNPADVTWKTMRASGPGGQHVNTTDSAVQATHCQTGLQVTASGERSQHANKKQALEKLNTILASRAQEQVAKKKQEDWRKHSELERGNPAKVFVGKEFSSR